MSFHNHKFVICKRCFKTYSEKRDKNNADDKLTKHKLKCNANAPVMPSLHKKETKDSIFQTKFN